MIAAWWALTLSGMTVLEQDMQVAEAQTAVVQEFGPYFVFFGFDSSEIDRDGSEILRQVADDYSASGSAPLTLTGHTDKSGATSYNRRLSERRVEAVRLQLIALGVRQQDITVGPDGEGQPLIDTADGVREAQNRRVEIHFD